MPSFATQVACEGGAYSLVVMVLAFGVYHILRVHHIAQPTDRVLVTQCSNLIYFASLLIWPFVFHAICQTVQTSVSQSPFLLIGFLWPIFLLLSRMLLIDANYKASREEDRHKYQETRSTGSLMFAAAFGVGILISSIRGAQDRQGSKLILASLLLCVAFFIPTHIFVCGTTGSQIVNVLQTCVLHIAIGIFMMGITLSYFSQVKP